MADEKTNLRIVRSRRVLYGWQSRGLPGGRPEDVLRMIGDEITILQGIIRDHPAKALSVGDLVRRWEALREHVKATPTH